MATARLAIVVATLWSSAQVAQAGGPLTFERHIRPILKIHCLDCHGATAEVEGELDLRLKRWMVAGGASGPAIEPGAPQTSYLVERIRAGEMPPGDKKMSPAELATIERWIAAGAPTAREEPEALDPGLAITPEEREFWSLQPLSRSEVPQAPPTARVRTTIDAFIFARLQEAGLEFAPDADERTLLMRAYFDLTGLPPEPSEVKGYLADPSADKYERLIDKLLASPRYGERWARHWLDVAGYADSEGYTPQDVDRPWAYKYRDYVIKSLNEDKPFDVFLEEQLAGDELVPPPHENLSEEQIEKLVATGFLRMSVDGTGSANNDDARNHTVADTIKIVSTSLLGLSVGCAQCHDHRYDPIPQQDYYQLRAIFEPALNWKQWRTPPQRLISLYTEEERKAAADVEAEAQTIANERAQLQAKFIEEELEKELAKYKEGLREKLRSAYQTPVDQRTEQQTALLKQNPAVNISAGTLYQYNQASADQLTEMDQRIADVRAKKPVQEFVRVLNEIPGEVPPTHVFYRGEHQQPRQEVSPAGLTIAAPPGKRHEIPLNNEALPTTGRRLAFARWLFNGTHPLVGRVLVNRVWMHHFGRGIVGTPGDFGVLGLRPTHPKLLDWMAIEFAESGWSLKKLHKQIMLSTVYRQSSKSDPAKSAIDSANERYWKKPVLRLDAEVIYDRILATGGAMEHQLYGPPAPIAVDDAGQTIVGADSKRRGIYVQVKRTQPVALLASFDAPVMEVNCDCRASSTASTQSLMLMNSEFILENARRLAERIRSEAGAWNDKSEPWDFAPADFDPGDQQTNALPSWPQQIVYAWQLAFGRSPTSDELAMVRSYLAEQFEVLRARRVTDPEIVPSLQAMTNLCQVLLSSNEFLYVD